MSENKKVARKGGNVAGNARKELEAKLGERVVSPLNAKKPENKNIKKIDLDSESK